MSDKGETQDNPLRVFSFGGGRQSMAVMVMQALGMLEQPYDMFLFANVGDKAENPDTLKYYQEVAEPFAEQHNITLKTIARRNRAGDPVDLYEYTMRSDLRSVPIPVYMQSGAPGTRTCTTDWKVRVVDKVIKQLKVKYTVIGLGISLDEFERAKDEQWHNEWGTKKIGFWKKREHPLIDMRFTMNDCLGIINRANLPEPPKSSCWFCPFQTKKKWQQLKNNKPDLFNQAIGLEKRVNEKRVNMERDTVYLTRGGKPLDEAISGQLELFPDDDCGGYCHT